MTVSKPDPTLDELMAELAIKFPDVFNTVQLRPSPDGLCRVSAVYQRHGSNLKPYVTSASFEKKADGSWPTQAEVDDFFVRMAEKSFTLWSYSTFENRPVWRDVWKNAKRMRRHPLHFLRGFGRFVWQWATWREPDYLKNPTLLFPRGNVPPKE